jgi:ParB/RepB/Spo0J family partition protein
MREDAVVANVPVTRLRAHPRNIRTELGDLRELAESIRYEGVLVPLMAERHGDHLRLLHGHRRWAAAQLAGVARVPVVIVPEHGNCDAIYVMLAEDGKERIARADRGRAVRALRDEFGCTWPDIAERLGKSVATLRAWVGGTDDDAGQDKPRPASTPQPIAARPTQHAHSNPPPRPARRQGTNPKIVGLRRVQDLLARHDAGQLDAARVVQELRGWLTGTGEAQSDGAAPTERGAA